MRHLDVLRVDQRGVPSLRVLITVIKYGSTTGLPSRRVHVDRTENSYVTDAIFRMYYVSLL